MNRKLIAFLKQNNAYDAFVKNLEDKVCNGIGEKYLNSVPSKYRIKRAFVWDDTQEGFDFWDDLSYRWECMYDKPKEVTYGKNTFI